MSRLVLCVALLLQAELALAGSPFQFAAPDLRAPEDTHVNGLRLSIFHGDTEVVRGVDIGLLSLSESRELSGLRLVAGMSRLSGDMSGGAAISLVNVHSGRDAGLNAALVNRLGSPDRAVNVGFVQVADGTTLVDVGGLNVSKQSTVQLGFVNVTEKITGVQIGFINAAENGFLPVFPIFNFARE
ncbi:MAG: phaC PHA synthase [Myxococcota bacterium]|nr:phaC PHA synthase [Myxococcota bacterium]